MHLNLDDMPNTDTDPQTRSNLRNRPQPQGKVFSPSLRASANSLFAPAGEGHQGSRGSREKFGSSPPALVADDSESGVIMAPSSTLENGGGGSVGAGALTNEARAVVSDRDGALAATPGSTVGHASSSPPTARRAASSPQDKDFVEEVR